MKHVLRAGLVLAATVCVTGQAAAANVRLNPGDKVDNFRLLDHAGKSHELYYLSDMKAVVLVAQGDSCSANRKELPQIRALRDKYGAQNVEFLMINSNLSDSRDKIDAAAAKQGIDFPIMMDETQLIGESLGLQHNGEVLVVNPKDWTLAYRGNAKSTADALDAVIAGNAVKTVSTKVKGCDIKMPELARRDQHAKISYEKTIAPMLIDNCVTCHRKGGIGPWQMTGYNMVRGFAPMIREVIRTERMPPWHADPHYGTFRNNRALSDDQIKTLVHWIEAGAPRGEGADPLAELHKSWPEWALGEPDLVLELPAFDVPATGVIPYQDVRVKNPIGKDVWLRAIDYAPGDRAVVHHILGYSVQAMPARAAAAGGNRPRLGGGPAGEGAQANEASQELKVGEPSPQSRRLMQMCSRPEVAAQMRASVSNNAGGASFGGASIGGYVPGAVPAQFPKDSGVLLAKDADFRFQIHYTTNGKASTDVTRVGLYFSTEKPKFPFRSSVLLDPCLTIPANTKAYTASMSRVIDRDIYIYSFTPHSHYRGAASNFVAEYPDGRKEILLSVPKYDFNWQTTYGLATPKFLPKGTRLTHSTTYDNSVQNKANPDPSIVVHWGEQSWEEMLYGAYSFRYADEVTDEQRTSQVVK